MNIYKQIKEIDKDLKAYKNEVHFYSIEERLISEINTLSDDSLITLSELNKFIKAQNIHYLLYSNKRYCEIGLYTDALDKYIRRFKIKKLANTVFIKKGNLQNFIDYANWWENIKEVKKKRAEYNKFIKKYYGDISKATKDCINSGYDCAKCENAEVCKMFKTEVSKKKFAKMVSLVTNNSTVKQSDTLENYYLKKKYNKNLKIIDKLHQRLNKKDKYIDYLMTLNNKYTNKKYLYENIDILENKIKRLKHRTNKLEKEIENLTIENKDLKYHRITFNERDLDVVELLLDGYKQKDLAEQFNISASYIHDIKANVLRKLRKLKKVSKQ